MKKASKRHSWTVTDVQELKTLARRKTPAAKIARTLKRTEGATRQKAFSMGLSLELSCVSLRTNWFARNLPVRGAPPYAGPLSLRVLQQTTPVLIASTIEG